MRVEDKKSVLWDADGGWWICFGEYVFILLLRVIYGASQKAIRDVDEIIIYSNCFGV